MSDNLDSIIADLQSYIVAPLNAFGLGGFVFDAEGESTAYLAAEITDHYTEDNRALQDHIAIKPKRVTLKGYVGEVVYNAPGSGNGILQTAVQKLTEISSYLPSVSAYATQAQELIQNPVSSTLTLSDASNIYGIVKNLINSTGDQARQQNAYMYFKALMSQGILMGVQTPWEFMSNMAIESVTAIQPEVSKYMTDFAVTLKQIRIAKTLTGAYSSTAPGQSGPNGLSPQANQIPLNEYRAANGLSTPPIDVQLEGAAAIQALPQVPLGNVPGVTLPTELLPGWQSTITGIGDITSNPAAMAVFKRAVGQ
jgi:Dit-like phage tail protein